MCTHCPALFGISTLPPGTFRDSHLIARWTEKGRFPTLQSAIENQTFGAGVTKEYDVKHQHSN